MTPEPDAGHYTMVDCIAYTIAVGLLGVGLYYAGWLHVPDYKFALLFLITWLSKRLILLWGELAGWLGIDALA